MSASAATPTEQLTSLLAGTQCTLCGYPSCAAYAEALTTSQTTNTTLCVPGGPRVAQALQSALGQEPLSNDELRMTNHEPSKVAFVQESDCIGCTLCLQKCPTAAIVGAPKQLHTILTSLCTGCNLCVPVCPTSCIILQPAPKPHPLTEQMPDGSLTPAASQLTWVLVNATEARKSSLKLAMYPTVTPQSLNPSTLSSLSPDLIAKIAAARLKNTEKYAAKGPIRQPRALTPKK